MMAVTTGNYVLAMDILDSPLGITPNTRSKVLLFSKYLMTLPQSGDTALFLAVLLAHEVN